ncbi:LuxR C-terminal-related transcriptional regulator [Agromyces sp. SYSU T00266]|uniref:LuxR C-terminal-related transcriptional regulator n=1 Tax=Agromyces zhanjiangensis TaxID=3158562 RepID=UPI003399A348
MIDVALIAPVRAYRDALAATIAADSEFRIVVHAPSFADAVSSIVPHFPRVALLDFSVADFLVVLRSVRRTAPTTVLVGMGIEPCREHSELVVRAAEAGLAGFLDADQPIEDVVGAMRLALRGESSCSPRAASLLLAAMQRQPVAPIGGDAPPATAALTPREALVAELIASGLTNRQIASRLVVEESTVKTHVHSILTKLGVAHRTDVMLAATEHAGSWRS